MQNILGFIILCLCLSDATAAGTKTDKNSENKTFVRGASTPAWVEKSPEIPLTKRSDPVVIRLSDTQVQNGLELSVYYYRAIQVNDQEALSVIGQYAISYVPDYQRLFVHQVAILRQGQVRDQTATATMHMLRRETQLEAGMFGGQVSLQMLLNDVRVGDTLLLSYTIQGKNPVFAGRWSNTFAWDSTSPVEHRRLIVTHPRERPLYWAQRGDFKTTPIAFKSSSSRNVEKLSFEERALDAVEEEPGAPSEYLPGRVLEFSEFHSWSDVAAWGEKLFPPQPQGTELKTLIQKFAKENTPQKRVAAALHWVQNEIRYFSVSLGENSHKPRPSAIVLKTRFGDCKDKSYLLSAILAGLELKAEPVLVSASSPQYPLRSLPSPLVFDHVVVRVEIDGKVYYIDPTRTGQMEQLEQLPVAVPKAAGLVVALATEKLEVLPEDHLDSAHFEIFERFTLPSLDGEGLLEARRTYRRDYAAAMRRSVSSMSVNALKKYALGLYEKTYPDLVLSETPALVEEGGNAVLITKYTIRHPLKLNEGRYELVVANKVLEGVIELPDKIVRNYPFVLGTGQFRGRHVMQVAWPERARINDEVVTKTLDNDYFRYHRDYFLRGNTLHYQMDYQGKTERIEAAAMMKLQEEAKRLERSLVGTFSVAADTLVSERASDLRYRDIEGSASAYAFGARVQMLEQNNASVEDLCLLALQAQLGRDFMPENLRDQPSDYSLVLAKNERDEAKRCVAGLAFIRQDFSRAIQLWESGASGDSDAILPKLAWARFFKGDVAGAVRDMRRYYERRVATGSDSASDLIRFVVLLQRAGSEVPDQAKKNLADQTSSVWPRPVAAFMAGKVDADSLLASAGSLPSAAREFAMAEAWYYIGASRLVKGDVAGARNAFRFLTANGVRSTMEYMLAQAEVGALESRDPDWLAGSDAEAQKKYGLAIFHYEKAVARGDAQAAYALGLLHYYGNGTREDKVRALPLIRKAAEAGIAGAQNSLAIYYDDGEGDVAVNPAEAKKWFAMAAAEFHIHGLRNFGNFLLSNGQSKGPDFDRAINYLQQSAGMGLHMAQADLARRIQTSKPAVALFWNETAALSREPEYLLQLAEQLRFDEGGLQDGKRAVKILTPLAEAGNLDAYIKLGMILEYGQGVEKNEKLALEWFERAARKGSHVASMRMARFYLYGVEKDYVKAAGLLEEAVKGDIPYANYLLAGLYRRGNGVAIDTAKARQHYERAAAGGIWEAQTEIGNLFYFGTEGRERAVEWYRKAAENGQSLAMNNLGDMYENGIGVPLDLVKAMDLYRQAANMGEGVAFRSIASLWASGAAGKIDLRQAYLYYLLAAKIEAQLDKGAEVVKQKLGKDELQLLETQAGEWKQGDPLPEV